MDKRSRLKSMSVLEKVLTRENRKSKHKDSVCEKLVKVITVNV